MAARLRCMFVKNMREVLISEFSNVDIENIDQKIKQKTLVFPVHNNFDSMLHMCVTVAK